MTVHRGVVWTVAAILLVVVAALWRERGVNRLPQVPTAGLPVLVRPVGVPPAASSANGPRAAAGPRQRSGEPAGGDASNVAPLPAVVAPRTAAGARPLRPGEIEVCGSGTVQGKAGASGLPSDIELPPELQERWDREVAALIASLATSAAPGAEAAAALMQGRLADLVRLALRDRDPRTVQWAVQACQGQSDPACLMAPPRLWVATEPDNGMAWLALLSAEPAVPADALYGLTRARRFDERVGVLVATVDAAIPSTASPQARATVLTQAMGIDMARSLPALATLFQICPASLAHDAHRREQCGAVAELLATRSGTLLARGMVAPLGERAGWPSDRVAATKRQKERAQQRMSDQVDHWLKLPPHGCEQLASLTAHVRDLARRGDWAVATEPAPGR